MYIKKQTSRSKSSLEASTEIFGSKFPFSKRSTLTCCAHQTCAFVRLYGVFVYVGMFSVCVFTSPTVCSEHNYSNPFHGQVTQREARLRTGRTGALFRVLCFLLAYFVVRHRPVNSSGHFSVDRHFSNRRAN